MAKAEDKKPDAKRSEKEETPASEKVSIKSRLSAVWARITGAITGSRPLRIGLIAAAAIVVVGSGIYLAMNSSRQAELAAAQATVTAQALAAQPSGPSLPAYSVPENDFSNGVPRLARLDTTIPRRSRVEVITYEVQQGDSVFVIADKFDLEPQTILWGNFDVLQDNPQTISVGLTLNILPTDGTYHRWSEGDTLESVAEEYDVEIQDILDWPGNNLDPYETDVENPGIAPGTWLIIPGGERELVDWGPPAISRDNPASAAYYGPGYCGTIYYGPTGTYTFIWPTPWVNLSGNDYNPVVHPAIDIGGGIGDSVYASDTGVVVYAGWSTYGYGNLIVIDHGNGWQTAYAHLNTVEVYCGQSVYQGERIGGLGTTGNSTGPHLHFEMRSELYGKVNPWNFLVY